MRLICTAPMGELQLLGQVVPAGEAFDVPDSAAAALLEQRGNVALAEGDKALDGLPADTLRGICAGRGLVIEEKAKKADLVSALTEDGLFVPEPAKEQ